MALTSDEQALVNELPASGEIPYADFRLQLITAGNERLLRSFHSLRRAGDIVARTEKDPETGAVNLFISRPASG